MLLAVASPPLEGTDLSCDAHHIRVVARPDPQSYVPYGPAARLIGSLLSGTAAQSF
jgi:hypothetical protein